MNESVLGSVGARQLSIYWRELHPTLTPTDGVAAAIGRLAWSRFLISASFKLHKHRPLHFKRLRELADCSHTGPLQVLLQADHGRLGRAGLRAPAG